MEHHRRALTAHAVTRPDTLKLAGAGPEPAATGDAAARVAARVRSEIGHDRFEGSFGTKALFRVDSGALEIATPNKVLSGLLERRFGDLIRRATRQELGDFPVRFVVAGDLFGAQVIPPAAPAPGSAMAASSATRAAPAARKAAPRPSATERYQFETFIVGESNRLAYNAAMALADGQAEAEAYSPLFIHGSCGVGKTHLVHAIARRFKETHAGSNVRVIGSEAFVNEYVAAVRAGDVEKFRRAFRRVDLLCIDDVHFLSNKQSTQGELLHTLDELGRGGAKMVLASDEPPRQIKAFSAALVSRFLQGMVAGIQPPDAALREKCVKMFAASRGLTLEKAAVDLIVQRTGQLPGQEPATVRDIEGLITRIDALQRLVPEYSGGPRGSAEPIGVLLVERALGNGSTSTVTDPGAPSRAARPVRIDAIITHTCAALAVDVADLSGKTRHPRVVTARAVITTLARQMTTLSYPEIARAIGRPNHSTVITAFQRFAKQLEADEAVDAPGAPEARTLTVLVRQIAAAAQMGTGGGVGGGGGGGGGRR
jgi:chromosomal replication initiator protein